MTMQMEIHLENYLRIHTKQLFGIILELKIPRFTCLAILAISIYYLPVSNSGIRLQ